MGDLLEQMSVLFAAVPVVEHRMSIGRASAKLGPAGEPSGAAGQVSSCPGGQLSRREAARRAPARNAADSPRFREWHGFG
jgi:hypothetical protein